MSTPGTQPVLVWDWPIRAFHWLLVASLVVLFVTGKLGGNWMEWHMRAGYFVIGLLLFRLLWGIVGSHHARFVNFVRGPGAVMAYLRGHWSDSTGHNPLGALSVIAMLAVIAFQAGSGLFVNDDIMLEGPYAQTVGKETSDFLTRLHKWNSNVILGLAGLHVSAIGFYHIVKKNNLARAMVTGRREGTAADAATDSPAPWLAPALIVLVTLAVYLLVRK